MSASEQKGIVYPEEVQQSLVNLHRLLLGVTEDNLSYPSEMRTSSEGHDCPSEEGDGVNLLQQILMGPLQTSIGTLEQKVHRLEAQVFDSTLEQAMAALQAQVADQSRMDTLRNELSAVSRQQQNLPSEINRLRIQVKNLENQLHEPEELMQLILPLLNDLIERKVKESGEEFARATAPVLDEMIRCKILQDKPSMGKAIAPVLSSAIGYQVQDSPGEFAAAIAPEMNLAIKEQVRANAASMIDALYPIMGSTIAKYIAEILRNINAKIESSMSPEGVLRKFRARLKGVSEAELILKESMGFEVQSVFLIQRLSGLVIAQAHPPDSPPLEADMIGGMLTAIRGFVQECIAQNGDMSELDRIEYGNSLICLEGAGSAYLAIVLQGEPPISYLEKVRRVMTVLVLDYGQKIESFEGNDWSIPSAVRELLDSLLPEPEARPRSLRSLWLFALLAGGMLLIPWGLWQWRHHHHTIVSQKSHRALFSTPELSVYQLQAKVDNQKIYLHGRVPNGYLRTLAQQKVQQANPGFTIENGIIAVQIPIDPTQTASEVERLSRLFQQRSGVALTSKLDGSIVNISGRVPNAATIQEVSQGFARIPGITSVVTTLQVPLPRIDQQIYFETNSATLKPEDSLKIAQVKALLDRHPDYRLNIIGQSDVSGSALINQQLALSRARSVRDALISAGVEGNRLQILGYPPSNTVRWHDRRVEFEVLLPASSP